VFRRLKYRAIACTILPAAAFPGLFGCANSLEVTTESIQVGDTVVELRTSRATSDGLWFVNVHDDENTSVRAAVDHVAVRGGTILELRHTGDRYVSFRVGADSFRVDPNRMFTDAGIRASLERELGYSDAAAAEVRGLANAILARMDTADPTWIVALHNNTEDSYSLESYLPGGPYASDASAIHRNTESDPDDFYFVTDFALYLALARHNANVVLQRNDFVTDDGSLSVRASRDDRRYVNVEAQHGHLRRQKRLIRRLESTLNRIENVD